MNYYPPVISAMVTFVLCWVLAQNKYGKMIDIPNERSLHVAPTPRTGGIALMAGILSGWISLFHFWVWWIVLPALGLFFLSLVDDLRGLSATTRLTGHFAAAIVALIGMRIDWIWFIPVLLFIVWMTNLFNFMDGSDGLAGGMALFGFSFYGLGGLLAGDTAFAMLNFVIGAAALGFLFHNFSPARMFMGDAGSIHFGFLAAIFGIWGWQKDFWPLWFPLLVFSPFVVDATVTLFKRTLRGEKLTQAHRSHYYQRLVQMGWGHRTTAIAEYVLMLLAGASALQWLVKSEQSQIYMLIGWGAVYFGLMMWVDARWRQREVLKENISAD